MRIAATLDLRKLKSDGASEANIERVVDGFDPNAGMPKLHLSLKNEFLSGVIDRPALEALEKALAEKWRGIGRRHLGTDPWRFNVANFQ